MREVYGSAPNAFKHWVIGILVFGLLALGLPADVAQAHMGSMSQTVDGMIFNMGSQPLSAEDGDSISHRYTLAVQTASGQAISGAVVQLLPISKDKLKATGDDLKPISMLENTARGQYTGVVNFPSEGQWELKITVVNGKQRTVVEFTDRIVSQPDSQVVLGFLGLLGLLAWSLRKLLQKGINNPYPAFDLLKISAIRRLLLSRYYPGILRGIVALVFAAVLGLLFWGPPLTNANLGWAITWLLWWPLVPLSILLLGRVWCAICPLPTAGDLVQKVGGREKKPPGWLRRYGIWLVNFFFLAITWFDVTYGLEASVRATGYLLLVILAGAVLMGLLYERRVFCRYLCPLGGIWGNYNVVSAVELKADRQKCSRCRTLECFRGNGSVEGCPMYLLPKTMDTSRNCTFCGNCLKTCPHQAIQVNARLCLAEVEHNVKAPTDVAYLAAVLVGLVFFQNLIMLSVWEQLTTWAMAWTGLGAKGVYTLFFLAAVFLPVALLWLAGMLAGKGVKHSGTFFAGFGLALIPFNLGSHLTHNLQHLLAQGKLLYWQVLDMVLPGQSIMEWVDPSANPAALMLADQPTITALQQIVLLIGAAGSLYGAYRWLQSKRETASPKALWVFLVVLVSFLVLNFWLLTQPMALRG